MEWFLRLLLCISIGIAGVSPVTADSEGDRQDMPWAWTTEERLAARFDVAQSAARAAASDCTDCAGTVVVRGRTDPQLLLPWELMTQLAGAYSADERQRLRRREIWMERAAGIGLPGNFWDLLDEVAGEFFDSENAQLELIRHLPSVTRKDAARLEDQLSDVQRGSCSARADAIAAARATFGAETFDRFLYIAVAPDLTVIDTITTAANHLWIERGCR